MSKSLAAKNRKRWPTGFFTQFRMLTWRNYKQAKGRVLHPYDVMKYIFLAAVVGALFYQIRQNEDSVRDRQGMVTFYLIIISYPFILNLLHDVYQLDESFLILWLLCLFFIIPTLFEKRQGYSQFHTDFPDTFRLAPSPPK